MFRLKIARACMLATTTCLLIVTAMAVGGGSHNSIIGVGIAGALIGFGGWRAGKLVA